MPLLDEQLPFGQRTMNGAPPPPQLTLEAAQAYAAYDAARAAEAALPPQLSIGPAPIAFTPQAQSPTFTLPAFTPPSVQTQVVDRVGYLQQQQQQQEEARRQAQQAQQQRQMLDSIGLGVTQTQRPQQDVTDFQRLAYGAGPQQNAALEAGITGMIPQAVGVGLQGLGQQQYIQQQQQIALAARTNEEVQALTPLQLELRRQYYENLGQQMKQGQQGAIDTIAGGPSAGNVGKLLYDVGRTEIPGMERVADVAGQIGRRAGESIGGSIGGPFAPVLDRVLPDALRPVNIAGKIGEVVAESLVPTEVWQAAIEFVPGVGTVPDLLKAVKAGAPEAITALSRIAGREDTQRIIRALSGETGHLMIPGTAKTVTWEDLSKAPQVLDTTGIAYHGTGSRFSEFSADGMDTTALYGPGVYLTDDAKIAKSYAETRARQAANTVAKYDARYGEGAYAQLGIPIRSPEATIQTVKIKPGLRVLNMEQPLPADAAKVFEDAAARLEQGADVVGALRSGDAGKVVSENLRQALGDENIPAYEAGDILAGVNDALKAAGYDGLTHTGGIRGGAKHTVTVIFDPANVEVATPMTRALDVVRGIGGKLASEAGTSKIPGKAAETAAEVVKPIEVPPEVKSVLAKRGVRIKPGSWEALPPVNRDFIADMAKTSVSNFDRKALLAEGRRRQVLAINEAYARTDLSFAERQALASKNMEGAILPEFQGVSGNYTPEKLAALKGQIDVAKDKGLISSFQWKTAGDVFDRLMTGGKQLEPAQKKLMGTIFGPEFEAAIPEAKNWNLWREATGVLGIPQALTSTLDISAVGRQMAPLGWTHPQAYLEALGTIKTAIRSDAGAAQVMHGLMVEPWMTNAPFPEAEGLSFVDLGGRLADIGGHLTESEGQFAALNQSRATRLVEKLPWVKPSERVYNVPINVLRGKVYQQYAKAMWANGERNTQAYKDVVNVIDHATGWSDFKMGQIASGINAFYSPRNTAARFQVLFDPFIKSGSLLQPSARQLAARNLVGFVSANITLLGAMAGSGILAGKVLGIPNPVSVELDPRSTDMWKGKIGNMRVDMTGGFGSIIRLVARLAPLATGNPAQVKNASGRIENADAAYLVDQFVRGKMGPVPGMVWDAFGFPGGESYAADLKSKAGLRTAAFNNLTPFFVQDVVEAWRQQNPVAAAIAAPVSFFGGSVNTYPPSEAAAKKEAKASGADDAAKIGATITAQKKLQPLSLEQDWQAPGWRSGFQEHFKELGDVSQFKNISELKAAQVDYWYAKSGNDKGKNEAETRAAMQRDFDKLPIVKEWDANVTSEVIKIIKANKAAIRKLHDAGQITLNTDELKALNAP